MPYERKRSGSSPSQAPRVGYSRTKNKGKKDTRWYEIPENLLAEAEDMVSGLPVGLYGAAQAGGSLLWGDYKPAWEIAQAIGSSYKHGPWGAAVEGDWEVAWDRFKDRPLSPLLDVAAVATLGVGGTVKAGTLASKAGVTVPKGMRPAPRSVGLANARQAVGQGGTYSEKIITGSELSRRMKVGADAALKRIFDQETRYFGEFSRAAKQSRKAVVDVPQARLLMRTLPWHQVSKGLSDKEGVALTLRREYPTEALLDSYVKMIDHSLIENLKKDRGVLEQVHKTKTTTTKRKPGTAPLDEYTTIHKENPAQVVVQTFLATRDYIAQGRAVNPLLDTTDKVVAWGLLMWPKHADEIILALEKVEPGIYTRLGTKEGGNPLVHQGEVKLLRDPEIRELHRNPTPQMIEADSVATALHAEWVKDLVKRGAMSAVEAHSIRWEPSLVAMGAKYDNSGRLLPAGWETIPKKIREGSAGEAYRNKMLADEINAIRGHLKSQGAPEPQYFPHLAELEEVRIPRRGTMRPPKSPVETRKGILELAGRVTRDPGAMLQRFLENGRFVLYHDVYEHLRKNVAVKVDDAAHEAALRKKGWVYLPEKNKRISAIEHAAPSYEKYLEDLLKEDHKNVFLHGTSEDLFTAMADRAAKVEGKRLMMPGHAAKRIVGDYTASEKVVPRLYREFTTVWRALVLNLRPGWLVNNIIGNTFLYAIQSAGPRGVAAYIEALGPQKAMRLMRREHTRGMSAEEMFEIFWPEQFVGTFFGTQVPVHGKTASVFAKKYAPTRWLRVVDIGYERKLRKATLDKLMRQNPQVRKFYNDMPKQTRSWAEAQRKALTQPVHGPRLVKRLSNEVNDGLGDFFSLSEFERRTLRGTMPFYAWYKAITVVSGKILLDKPVRANVMAQLGLIGDAAAAEDFGLNFLRGGIDLGNNAILRTRQANPFVTTIDLVRSFAAVFGGGKKSDVRNASGTLNPIFELPAAITRAEMGQGYSDLPAVPAGFYQVIRDLPLARLLAPYESKLYKDSGRGPELRSYLGFPWRTVDPVEARKRAQEEAEQKEKARELWENLFSLIGL